MRLASKKAIITGATSGIGEATAKLFLADGANVMLAERSKSKLRETHKRLGRGDALDIAVADATDEAANEEVANLALFLASDEASCTGGYHLVDGGYVAA